MRLVVAASCLIAFACLAATWPAASPLPEQMAGKCVGADPCLACKTCRSCKHCKGEGSCGACKSKKGERALAYFADPVCR